MIKKNDNEPSHGPSIDESLKLVRAFKNIENAADRLKVIELARRLSSDASKHSQPVRH
jgi:hypothetical protein